MQESSLNHAATTSIKGVQPMGGGRASASGGTKRFGARTAGSALAGAVMAGSVLVGSVLVGCEISDKDIEYIRAAELRQLTVKAESDASALLLVDPRSPTAFERARIAGAINMELRPDMVERGVDPRLAGYDNIVVYGDNPGSVSARGMTKRLMAVGYDDVRLFAGGLDEWRAMQYPIESSEPGEAVEPSESDEASKATDEKR
jgi:rhodanese-related sulfurtransferase